MSAATASTPGSPGMLSRVADSLYWMSRYLERAENTARLLDVHLNLALELSPAAGQSHYGHVLRALGVTGSAPTWMELVIDPSRPESLVSCIGNARENARQIREQISSEMFEQLNKLFLFIGSDRTADLLRVEPHTLFQKVKDGAHLFQGITDSTMIHGQGWRWIQIGRHLERASMLVQVLLHFLRESNGDPDWLAPQSLIRDSGMGQSQLQTQTGDVSQPDPDSEIQQYPRLLSLLKNFTAWEACCKIYGAELTSLQVAEFLLLNPEFPHSLHFGLRQLAAALDALAQETGMTTRAQLENRLGRLLATVRYTPIGDIVADSVSDFLRGVGRDLDASNARLYQVYLSQTAPKAED